MCSTGGTPQKNTSTFFNNPYNQENTPKKVLNNIEITASEVLKERNNSSDIFNMKDTPEKPSSPDSERGEVLETLRSNDKDNDQMCSQFRQRQQKSNVFGGSPEPARVPQRGSNPNTDSNKPYKISNVF